MLVASFVFTVAVSWWFTGIGTAYTQESFIARGDGPRTFSCRRQDAWGITRWDTSPVGADSIGAPVEVPSWVMPAAGQDEICETHEYGWPMRAMYAHCVLTRIPGIGWSTQTSDSYDRNKYTSTERRFPLGRIWTGLAVDAALWAAVFGALWVGALWFKGFVARRRGLCESCGYDLRGLAADAVCPECGTGPRGRRTLPT